MRGEGTYFQGVAEGMKRRRDGDGKGGGGNSPPHPKSRRVEHCPHTTGAAAAATAYKGVQK